MPLALGNSQAKKFVAETVLVEGDLLVAGEIKQAFKEQNTTHQDHTELKTTQTGTLEIGNHETRNTVFLHSFGSKISFSYNFRFQADTIHTTEGNGIVKLHIMEEHGLEIGDTIHISNVSGVSHNGITVEHLTGSFTLEEGAFTNGMVINTPGVATQSSSIAQFIADITCTVYSTLDLHNDPTTWVRSTAQPGTVIAPNGTRLNQAAPYPVAGS